MRILFAEDNAAFRLVLKNQLEFVGHQVVMAVNGKQALALARDTNPDLIISDIQMPEMDGYQFCQAVRADASLAALPFIFYTGTFVTPEDEALALGLGADRFLRKPVELGILLQEIRTVAKHKTQNTTPSEPLPSAEAQTLYQQALSRKLGKKYAESVLYREIVNQSNDAIVVTDREDHLLLQNPAHQRLFSLPEPPPLDWTPAQTLGVEALQSIREALAQGGRYSGEIMPPDQQLAEVCLDVTAFVMTGVAGEVEATVFIIRDASCRKQEENEKRALQTQLIQAQKMEVVGRLAGGIAHDFNNILNAILGYSELALLDLPDDNPAGKSIKVIQSSGEKAIRLVRQLLAFSRKQILQIAPVNINQVICDLTQMMSRLIGEDIKLHLHLTEDSCETMADQSQLEQIILNLAVNARDAMPDGGTMTICTGRADITPGTPRLELKPGQYITVSITDSGSGMDQATKERIFEPFFTTKEIGKGTGLGLATVFGIIKQHQGHISVDSHPGHGATFTLFLPALSSVVIPPAGEAVRPAQPMAQGKETILVVEDDASSLKLLVEILTPLGYTILTAADGSEAIRLVTEGSLPIDLLLTDVILPGKNGRQIAEVVSSKYPAAKTLFMSGYTDDILSPHKIHRLNFIQKPFSPLALTVKIRQILDQNSPRKFSLFASPRPNGGAV